MGISRQDAIYGITGSVVQSDVCKEARRLPHTRRGYTLATFLTNHVFCQAGWTPRSIAGPSGQEQDCRGRPGQRVRQGITNESNLRWTSAVDRDRCLFAFSFPSPTLFSYLYNEYPS